MKQYALISIILAFYVIDQAWADNPVIRVGVLKFGTVNWELQTIIKNKLDLAEGFKLEVVPFAGKLATTTALHGSAVDAIVNDWIWVSRQRSEGRTYSFFPYSRISGALMVSDNSGINTLADLQGKKLGIAGGPVDKSWLLIQALATRKYGVNLASTTDLVFGAPPLLAKKLEMGELDAVINFWHYAAKLEAAGFKRLIDIQNVLVQLGIKVDIPMIGYVFSPEYTRSKVSLIQAFSRASRNAKALLRTQDKSWELLKPMMKAKSDKSFRALKAGFIRGIPDHWGDAERAEAGVLFNLLADAGGKKLVGKIKQLDTGTFIDDVRY